jgi:hypothetical protein
MTMPKPPFLDLARVRDAALSFRGFLDVNRQWQMMVTAAAFGFRYLPFVTAIVVGSAWTLFAVSHGVDLSQDSCFYLKTASFMHYDGNLNTQVTVWPPLYPFLINLFLYLTPWPATAASMASGLFCLWMLLALALLLDKILRHAFVGAFLIIALVSLEGFWEVFASAWSENAFGLLIALNLLFVYLHHQKKSLYLLFFAAIFASAAAMTKYSGAALLVVFFFYVFYCAAKTGGIKARLFQAVCLVLAVLPNLLWSLRNHGIDATWTGQRNKTSSTLADNFNALVNVIEKDVPLILLFVFLFFFVFFLYRVYRGFVEKRGGQGRSIVFETYVYAFLVAYCLGLVYAASTTNINRISTRFLSPIYFVFFVAAAASARNLLDIERPAGLTAFVGFAMSVCLAFVAAGNLKGTSKYLRTLTKVEKKQDAHLTFGFEKSRLSKKLSRYIDWMFRNRDTALVSGYYNMHSPRHHLMYGLFTREGLFGEDATDVVYQNRFYPEVSASPRYLFQKSELVLTYTKAGKRRRIDFQNLPRAGSTRQLLIGIDALMKENKAGDLFFFYTRPVRRRAKFNFDQEVKRATLPKGLDVANVKALANITAYYFVRNRGRTESADLNRRRVENARVLSERSSKPSEPRVMPRRPARAWGSVDRGKHRRAIELRKHPNPEAELV